MKRNKVQTRKLKKEYIARILNCSMGYVTKKLSRLGTTTDELLKALKEESGRKHLSHFDKTPIGGYFKIFHITENNVLEEFSEERIGYEIKEIMEKTIKEIKLHYLTNNKRNIGINISFIKEGRYEATTRFRLSDQGSCSIEVQMYNELHSRKHSIKGNLNQIQEKGNLKFVFFNPATKKEEHLPIKSTKNGFIINGKRILLSYHKINRVKIARKNLEKQIKYKIHKPLYLGRDNLGFYIGANEIKYHINNFKNIIGWSHITETTKEHVKTLGAQIIKDCLIGIKQRKEQEEKRMLESKYKDIIYSNLDKLYLDFQTSRESGNCQPGTEEIYNISRRNLHLDKDSGDCAIRADIIKNIVDTTHPHFQRNFDNLLFSVARQSKLIKNLI